MAKRIVRLTFPEDLVNKPIIFQMAKKFDLIPNIKRAKVSETAGEVVLEITGDKEKLKDGLAYITELGVIVENIPGDIVEG